MSTIFGLAVAFLAFLYARDRRIVQEMRPEARIQQTDDVYVQNEPKLESVPYEDDVENFTDLKSIQSNQVGAKNPFN